MFPQTAVDLVVKKYAANVRRWGGVNDDPYRTFNSYHEAKAVCEEELDELWDEIKSGQDPDRIRKEAIDLAAAALALVAEARELSYRKETA